MARSSCATATTLVAEGGSGGAGSGCAGVRQRCDEAERAVGELRLAAEHPFPGCFVCGTGRDADDGLRSLPGDMVAAGATAGRLTSWTRGREARWAGRHGQAPVAGVGPGARLERRATGPFGPRIGSCWPVRSLDGPDSATAGRLRRRGDAIAGARSRLGAHYDAVGSLRSWRARPTEALPTSAECGSAASLQTQRHVARRLRRQCIANGAVDRAPDATRTA